MTQEQGQAMRQLLDSISCSFRPGTADKAEDADEPAPWATEALEQFTQTMAARFGIPVTDVKPVSLAHADYSPGICAGTLLYAGAHGEALLNLTVDSEPTDSNLRRVRPLIPVGG